MTPLVKPADPDDRDFPPLTAAQRKELQRRLDDLDDPTRFIIVSAFSPRFFLYYNAESGCYGTDMTSATLFKRRAAAHAVRRTLSTGKPRDSLQVIPVKKVPSGWRLLGKIKPRF